MNGYLSYNGSDQLPVSTKFDMRSDPGVVRNYGKLLVEMVSVVPDGIVCFFVSYSYMDGIINSWNESGILKVKYNFCSYVSSCATVLTFLFHFCAQSGSLVLDVLSLWFLLILYMSLVPRVSASDSHVIAGHNAT